MSDTATRSAKAADGFYQAARQLSDWERERPRTAPRRAGRAPRKRTSAGYTGGPYTFDVIAQAVGSARTVTVAAALGVSETAVCNWRRWGLGAQPAGRVAEQLGTTVAALWPGVAPPPPRRRGPSRPTARPYPFADLVAVIGKDATAAVIAAKLGIGVRQVHRLRRAGGLTEVQADELAVRLGLHPAEVWGHW